MILRRCLHFLTLLRHNRLRLTNNILLRILSTRDILWRNLLGSLLRLMRLPLSCLCWFRLLCSRSWEGRSRWRRCRCKARRLSTVLTEISSTWTLLNTRLLLLVLSNLRTNRTLFIVTSSNHRLGWRSSRGLSQRRILRLNALLLCWRSSLKRRLRGNSTSSPTLLSLPNEQVLISLRRISMRSYEPWSNSRWSRFITSFRRNGRDGEWSGRFSTLFLSLRYCCQRLKIASFRMTLEIIFHLHIFYQQKQS